MDLEQQPWPKLYQAAELAIEQERWLAAELCFSIACARTLSMRLPIICSARCFGSRDGLSRPGGAAAGCQLDASLGWNWFAAGELLMKLKRITEAAEAFEVALHALPAEGWIRDQLASARLAELTGAEKLSEGLGPKAYQFWIEEHEPRLPSGKIPPANPFWLLEPHADGTSGGVLFMPALICNQRKRLLGIHHGLPMAGWFCWVRARNCAMVLCKRWSAICPVA